MDNHGTEFGRRALRGGIGLVLAAALTALPAFLQPARADQAAALRILKTMSDYMGRQQTLSATFDADVEVVTPQLQKIQFTASGSLTLDRKGGLRARRTGAYADLELVFDGKTASVHNVGGGTYAAIAAPGSVDDLIGLLRRDSMLEIPGADLLFSDAYTQFVADATEAVHLGRGIIDGVECEHIAFRATDVDWQLWVEAGDRPVPRKYVITSKAVSQAPQFTLRLKEVATGQAIAAGTFAFQPPSGVRQVSIGELGHLDEVPPGTPAKGLQP